MTTLSNALTQAGVTNAQVINTYSHYDPADTIETLDSSLMKAMVYDSMYWRISQLCIARARSLLFKVRETCVELGTAGTTIDEFNTFIALVSEIKAGEHYNEELGFEQNSGLLKSLAMLLDIRQQWYDRADMFAGAAKYAFRPKTLEELMLEDKLQKVDADSASKLKTFAEFGADGDDETQERIYKMMLDASNKRKEQQFTLRRVTMPAVSSIISMAEYRGVDNTGDVIFHHLANDAQLSLINGFARATEQAIVRLSEWKSVSPLEFAAVICKQGFAAMKEFKAAAASPKFQDH